MRLDIKLSKTFMFEKIPDNLSVAWDFIFELIVVTS